MLSTERSSEKISQHVGVRLAPGSTSSLCQGRTLERDHVEKRLANRLNNVRRL